MKYNDLRLTAGEAQFVKDANGRHVSFKLTAVGLFGEPFGCSFDPSDLSDVTAAIADPDATLEDAIALGTALGKALFPDALANAIDKRIAEAKAAGEGLRLHLILSGPLLAKWPWEFLLINRGGGNAKESDFLALMPEVSIVREPPADLDSVKWNVPAAAQVQMAVLLASPDGWQPRLKVDKERDVIQKAVGTNPRVAVSYHRDATAADLPDTAHPAHIFHFAGHGTFATDMARTPGALQGSGALVFDDGNGGAAPFNADSLGTVLRNAGVRLAVLGACLTAQRDDVQAWSSVGETLLKAELGAVVGMQFPVRDDSAVAFAAAFYPALVSGLSIDEAMSAGRLAVVKAGDIRGWGTPVLYLRMPDGILFTEAAADPALDGERERTRIVARAAVDLIKGKLTVAEMDEVANADVNATLDAKTIDQGADVHVFRAGKVGSGTRANVDAKSDTVKGKLTGAEIDSLGD